MGRPFKEVDFEKQYKNKAEQEFAVLARQNGWKVTKVGWPDFICMQDGKIACVEVKKNATGRLKKSQELIFKLLSERDIPCFVWSPGSTDFSALKKVT